MGLNLRNWRLIQSSRCVKSHTALLRLKHPINHADMKTSDAQFREPQAKGRSPANSAAGYPPRRDGQVV